MQELGPLQKEILKALYASKDEIHVNELARQLRKSPVTISISLKQLTTQNFVSTSEVRRGQSKSLRLTPKGVAALFVHVGIDPFAYYSEKGELPVFLQDMIRLFPSDRKLAKRFSLQAFEFAFGDTWTTTQGDKVIYDGVDEKQLDILMAVIHSAKVATLAGKKVDKSAYVELVNRFKTQAEKYAIDSLSAVA